MTNILNTPNLATAIKVSDESHWHALRASTVGGSEVASLFHCSPYMTEYELWHQKKGNMPSPDFKNERIKWGNRLEHAIATGIAEDKDWLVRKVHRYMRHREIYGMGASLDYEILNHPSGMGALEIKNVDRLIWYSDWEQGEQKEAPLHIELQLQHQLAVSGYKWGAIGCLVGGNESYVIIRERQEKVIAAIENRVKTFWDSLNKNTPPKPNFTKDLQTIQQVYNCHYTEFKYTEDSYFDTLCADYQKACNESKRAETDKEVLKAQIIDWLSTDGLEAVNSDIWQATYKEQSRPETVSKASKFRVLRIKEKTNGNRPSK